jgi:hypothetical protein
MTTTEKTKHHVRRPFMSGGQYVIIVSEGISPTSPVIERVPCGTSRETAFQAYRQIKKNVGKWI